MKAVVAGGGGGLPTGGAGVKNIGFSNTHFFMSSCVYFNLAIYVVVCFFRLLINNKFRPYISIEI